MPLEVHTEYFMGCLSKCEAQLSSHPEVLFYNRYGFIQGFFLAILGSNPRAFQIGKSSMVNP